MLLFRAIASGSNGNCSIFQTPDGALLIDAGISCRRILDGIKELKIEKKEIKYVLITHAHYDHIVGLAVLFDQLNAKLIATQDTINEIKKLKSKDIRYFLFAENSISIGIHEPIVLDSFEITTYPTYHDIDGSSCFKITYLYNDFTLTYITDSADIPESVQDAMKSSDLIVIESNHNVKMLNESSRPIYLKQRIKATHMTNKKTMEILSTTINERTKAVYLAHLSGECNRPELVTNLIKNNYDKIDYPNWKWAICLREESSSIFESPSNVLYSNFNDKKFTDQIIKLSGSLDSNSQDIFFKKNKLIIDNFFDT